jgi:hypothetical protein
MNKYKVLGAALMVSIIILIGASHALGMTSIQYMTSGTAEFMHSLGILTVILFGSFAALTLDKLY